MSEFKEPKIGDKIIIPEGFILVGFDGDYKKVYEVADYFFDNKHGMPFITFEANGKKYTFPPDAFDKASNNEITAGYREGTKEFDLFWYGQSLGEAIKAHELLGEELIEGGAAFVGNNSHIVQMVNDLGDDFPIENHISPHCQSRDV